MSSLVKALTLGAPLFGDAPLSNPAPGSSGATNAWQTLLWRDPLSALASMRGDFAIGVRDASGRTVLAVDRFAIQTLCYRVDADGLRFAARADELVDTDTEIDPQAIFDYLYFHVIPSPRTIYKSVFRLPPGHYALFENGKLTVAPYWTPRFEEPTKVSFDTLRDEFNQRLRGAVARQLGNGHPACFLSGGTDSSTVAGLAGEVAGQRASTYSIGFAADGYDEMEYARIAARHFGTRHHEYYVTPDDLVRSVGDVAGSFDQPFGNSSVLPAYYCARLAKTDNAKRILAGDGGDELFGGNSRYAMQRVFDWYRLLPRVLRDRAVEPLFGLRWVGRMPLLKKGSSYVAQAKVPMPARLQIYNLLLRLGIDDVLQRDFVARIDAEAPLRQQNDVWVGADSRSELNRTLAYDWRYTLAESDLPKVRGATGLAGVAVGFPLLDTELLEFSMRLPPAYKLRGVTLRWFFKQALRGFLPDAILAKKKHGFGLPFGIWLTSHPGLQRLAFDSLGSLSTRGIVRPDFISTLTGRHLRDHAGYYGEMVWILMMLEQWLRRRAPHFKI